MYEKKYDFLCPIAGVLFFLTTCKKSGGNSDVINIQGFYTMDYNGNSLGWQGPLPVAFDGFAC